jgi:hypothetical protein
MFPLASRSMVPDPHQPVKPGLLYTVEVPNLAAGIGMQPGQTHIQVSDDSGELGRGQPVEIISSGIAVLR